MQHDKTATLRPFVTVRLIARTPQWRDAFSEPGTACRAESCFERTSATLTVGATRTKLSSSSAPLFMSPVSTTAPSLGDMSRMKRSMAVQTDLRLAHSSLMWTLATVSWEHDQSGALRILLVTTMARDSPRWVFSLAGAEERRARVAGLERAFVEEDRAVVLGNHVESRAFLDADNMPRAFEVRGVLPANSGPNPEGLGFQERSCNLSDGLFNLLIRPQRWAGRAMRRWLRMLEDASVLAHAQDRPGPAACPTCSPGRRVARAMRQTRHCHLLDNTRRRPSRGVASCSQLHDSHRRSC